MLCYRFAYRASAGQFGASLAGVWDLEAQREQDLEDQQLQGQETWDLGALLETQNLRALGQGALGQSMQGLETQGQSAGTTNKRRQAHMNGRCRDHRNERPREHRNRRHRDNRNGGHQGHRNGKELLIPGHLEGKAPGPQEPGAVMAWTEDAGTEDSGAAGTKPRVRTYRVEV